MRPYPWHHYSKKMRDKLDHPRCWGWFTREDATDRQMHYVEGRAGVLEDGNVLALYWLVDPTDGTIVDAKFQAFGQTALLAAAEIASLLLVGKNYDQAKRVGAELIDKQVRDHPDTPAFPEETLSHLNLVIDAIDDGIHQCLHIPLGTTYVSPVPVTEGTRYPGWEGLSTEQKLAVLEDVMTTEVRPYVALDAGGVEIVSLREDRELLIRYQGSCTSCFSAVGATLSSIQQILQTKVHPNITVVPDLSTLQL